MENGFGVQHISHPGMLLTGLPEALRMQLGPFNPQLQEGKGLSIHSLNASAFRLRYGNNYPGFPAHLIHHLQPQLFPTAVDPRSAHFTAGAFRPFNVTSSPNKLFPSAFAPPQKQETHQHDSNHDLSPGNYVSKLYSSNDNDDDASFRSAVERDELSGEHKPDMQSERSGINSRSSSISPKSTSVKEERLENGKNLDVLSNVESDTSNISNADEDNRSLRRHKQQFDPTCCPICGIIVLLGDTESHFFKELDRLSQITPGERNFNFDKTHTGVHACFSVFGNAYVEDNGHSSDNGLPRGRWETYQRIKSNRLSRLRIKNRRRRTGDPLCPVCNEKMHGSVEDINLHVEHCLKKHSDEVDEDEDENIDVEGDSEVYGEYDWAGRHLIRATTLLVGGFAAGLLTTAANSNPRSIEKDDVSLTTDRDDSEAVTSGNVTDSDVNMADDSCPQELRASTTSSESHFGKCGPLKQSNGK